MKVSYCIYGIVFYYKCFDCGFTAEFMSWLHSWLIMTTIYFQIYFSATYPAPHAVCGRINKNKPWKWIALNKKMYKIK